MYTYSPGSTVSIGYHDNVLQNYGDYGRLETSRCGGLQETDTMRARDAGKDQTTDGSANVSCFNVNLDCLNKYGFYKPDRDLDTDDNIWDAIKCMEKFMSTEGIDKFLNFHRGGRGGYEDPSKYQCQQYRDGIATMYTALLAEPSMLSDDRRLYIPIKGV